MQSHATQKGNLIGEKLKNSTIAEMHTVEKSNLEDSSGLVMRCAAIDVTVWSNI